MMTPTDIKTAMLDLKMNIISSIKELLDSKGLTELTFFEKENVPTLNFADVPHSTFEVCDATEYLLVRKMIKVNGVWGIIHYDTDMRSDEFIKPLTDLLQDFKQAQALHAFIYSIVVRERNPLDKERTKLRRRNTEPLGDLAQLEALKKELEGGE